VADTIPPTGLSLNFARVRDVDITSGMNKGRASADIGFRQRAYAKAQRAPASESPYLWLNRSWWRVAATGRFHDARKVTLPDGRPALPLVAGTHRLTEPGRPADRSVDSTNLRCLRRPRCTIGGRARLTGQQLVEQDPA
jgi:hypothetical protein